MSDVGVLDTGAPYFVMELLDGRDLASVLATHGAMPVPVLADYIVQPCVGLAEAHAAQIVHCDLKPGNLFLTHRPDGTPLTKIVDFGIAKDATSVSLQLTRTDAVMGSPGYMSPERLRPSRIADAPFAFAGAARRRARECGAADRRGGSPRCIAPGGCQGTGARGGRSRRCPSGAQGHTTSTHAPQRVGRRSQQQPAVTVEIERGAGCSIDPTGSRRTRAAVQPMW